jgi:hypothetical protein
LVSDIKGGTQNRVLRRIFGPKRDKIIGDLRKMHTAELHHFTVGQILFG